MRVYRVDAFGRPLETKFRYYAQLAWNKADEGALEVDNFAGRPYPRKWRSLKLFFQEPLWPRADFYYLRNGIFVCSGRAKNLLLNLMKSFGEFLPVSIEGEKETHYIYNVTNCCDLVDPIKSIWECEVDEPEEVKNPTTAILEDPAFVPGKLEGNWIFRIPKRSQIYCFESDKISGGGQFKRTVEEHKLVGLRFELAWDKKGPKPKMPPPTKGEDFVWMTGDGKKYKSK